MEGKALISLAATITMFFVIIYAVGVLWITQGITIGFAEKVAILFVGLLLGVVAIPAITALIAVNLDGDA